MTKPTFITVANTLKRRACRGPGLSVEDMQRTAGEVIEEQNNRLREEMQGAIADSREMVQRWKAGGEVGALVAKLNEMAGAAQDQGRTFGNPLLTEVGTKLGVFMALFSQAASSAKPSAKATIAIGLHLDAMVAAINQGQSDRIDDAGRVLLQNLELTQRTLA